MKKKRLLSWFLAMVMVLGMLPVTAWANEVIPFTAEAGEEQLDVKKSEEGYEYSSFFGVGTADLYVVTVPAGMQKVVLDFGEEPKIAYGYDSTGGYQGAYAENGEYENGGQTGEKTAVVADGLGNYVWVQTPYTVDENGTWITALEYVIMFDVEPLPFSLKIDDEIQPVTRATTDYQYTVVLEYDSSWNPVKTENRKATLYEAEVPEDAESIIITFEEERLASGYGADQGYLAAYGDYGDGTKGRTTATVPADGVEKYIRVQTPYVAGSSDLLYVIHLIGGSQKEVEGKVSMVQLLKTIAASYQDNYDDWPMMDMVVYAREGLGTETTTEKAEQKYLNSAIEKTAAGNGTDNEYSKIILTLTAMGIDAELLYPIGSETPVNALDCLRTVKSSGIWGDAFKLMALSQKDKNTVDETEKALLQSIIERQEENGSWIRNNDPIQTTGIVLNALAFYQGYTYDEVAVADVMAKAVAYLKEAQQADGTFVDGNAADANTAAMLVTGLAAAGEDPASFGGNNGVSALDALLQFALKDNSGFGYTNASTWNEMATEQGFRALIAAKQMETKDGFNIYDFSQNTELDPGYAKEIKEETPSRPSHKNDDITVEVSIKAIDEYWMKNKDVTVDEDATVYDAFMEAIDNSDIEQEGAEKGYISSMTKDGEELGEFDKGKNSGWLYEVNNKQPDVGIKNYRLKDGDEILFYYTEDWTEDKDALSRNEEEETEEVLEEIVEEVQEKEPLELPVLEEIYTDISADGYYYEAAQWAVAKGIVSGVTENEFGADWNCSRGQLMTFLWRMMGSPEPETRTAPYIDVEKDMYYNDAILWAVENKLANGTDGISFSPEMTLTRGQAVTFLWRTAGMPEPAGTHTFADVADTDYYAKAVQWAAENGITSGTGDGCFSPEVPCTRGQILTFLYRCFGK